MKEPQHDGEAAEKDIDGDVTANNQDGQTEQEILDEADTKDDADTKGYEVCFKETITIEACSRDDAFIKARCYWDSNPKPVSTELDVTIVEAD